MEKKLFAIVLFDGKNIKNTTVTIDSLRKIIDDFIDNDGNCLCITKTSSIAEKQEIQKFYKTKYAFFNRKYKANKMTQTEYKEAINKLKEIKSESDTIEEFEIKFNEYKKTLTIIPPYNVSE